MREADAIPKRRTSADIVFERLYDEIMSLGRMPGETMSESDVAERFGVSRQPVRDAFSRLGNLDLLTIQPQRATQVRRFSLSGLAAARFVRLALELEVARTAALRWTGRLEAQFARNLERQDEAVASLDRAAFHRLDEAFHRLIARAADAPAAFELIVEKKAQVDRICVLSLKEPKGMGELVDDHRAILAALAARDLDALEARLRLHLSRIKATIAAIRARHPDYFDD